MGCLICEEYQNQQNTFLENDLFRARWDQLPVSPGHAEVVPKRHVQFFKDLTLQERNSLLDFVASTIEVIDDQADLAAEYERLLLGATDYTRPHLSKAYQQAKELASRPDAYNHGINDGPYAGQTIPHFHYHIIPRWQGDVANPRGGVRRIFGEDAYSEAKS